MVIVKVEPPGWIHQLICTFGRLAVLAGALWKGRSEYKEMMNVGFRKYFHTTVKQKRSKFFNGFGFF